MSWKVCKLYTKIRALETGVGTDTRTTGRDSAKGVMPKELGQSSSRKASSKMQEPQEDTPSLWECSVCSLLENRAPSPPVECVSFSGWAQSVLPVQGAHILTVSFCFTVPFKLEKHLILMRKHACGTGAWKVSSKTPAPLAALPPQRWESLLHVRTLVCNGLRKPEAVNVFRMLLKTTDEWVFSPASFQRCGALLVKPGHTGGSVPSANADSPLHPPHK